MKNRRIITGPLVLNVHYHTYTYHYKTYENGAFIITQAFNEIVHL